MNNLEIMIILFLFNTEIELLKRQRNKHFFIDLHNSNGNSEHNRVSFNEESIKYISNRLDIEDLKEESHKPI